MHICWREQIASGYSSWVRMKNSTGGIYEITMIDITPENQILPQIVDFSHQLGGTYYEGDKIWFKINHGWIFESVTIKYRLVKVNSNLTVVSNNKVLNSKFKF